MYMPIMTVRNLSDLGLNSISPSCLWSIWSSTLLGFSSMELAVDMVEALCVQAFDVLLELLCLLVLILCSKTSSLYFIFSAPTLLPL